MRNRTFARIVLLTLSLCVIVGGLCLPTFAYTGEIDAEGIIDGNRFYSLTEGLYTFDFEEIFTHTQIGAGDRLIFFGGDVSHFYIDGVAYNVLEFYPEGVVIAYNEGTGDNVVFYDNGYLVEFWDYIEVTGHLFVEATTQGMDDVVMYGMESLDYTVVSIDFYQPFAVTHETEGVIAHNGVVYELMNESVYWRIPTRRMLNGYLGLRAYATGFDWSVEPENVRLNTTLAVSIDFEYDFHTYIEFSRGISPANMLTIGSAPTGGTRLQRYEMYNEYGALYYEYGLETVYRLKFNDYNHFDFYAVPEGYYYACESQGHEQGEFVKIGDVNFVPPSQQKPPEQVTVGGEFGSVLYDLATSWYIWTILGIVILPIIFKVVFIDG